MVDQEGECTSSFQTVVSDSYRHRKSYNGNRYSLEKEFSAKEFVDNLLTKGSCLACDESSNSFNNNDLPPYYNEDLYKKGQAYFYKNLFGMSIGNLLGLFCVLADKAGLAILILTKMSSSDLTAYKRYAATIFHMMIWYDSEFKPGSRLWESIKDVKLKHNSASKKAEKTLKYRITQKHMALTQFGFMGLVVSRSKFLGIYDANDKNLECFIHVWRVIGYVLGIEDEFNLCRESVAETKAICNEVVERIFKPEIEKKDKQHREMCSYLANGLWVINPFINLNTFMFYLELTLNNSRSSANDKNADYNNLTKGEKNRLHVVFFVTEMMKYSLVRIILRYLHLHSLWMAKHFPYLAYYKFGKENSGVQIFGKHH